MKVEKTADLKVLLKVELMGAELEAMLWVYSKMVPWLEDLLVD